MSNEVKEEPIGIAKSISFYILAQDKEIKSILENGKLEDLEPYLTQLGIDVSLPYEVLNCEHRPMPSKPFVWNGPILQGYESLTKEWLKSGFASLDAIIFSERHRIGKELSQMSRQGCGSIEAGGVKE